MKIALFSLLAFLTLSISSRADVSLREPNVGDAIMEILPEYQWLGGDHTWSGGIGTNGFAKGDIASNSAHCVFGKAANARLPQVAEHVRDALQKRYGLPSKDVSRWLKKTPQGLSDNDFAEAYYWVNNLQKQVYLSVGISRLDANRIGITVTYFTLEATVAGSD